MVRGKLIPITMLKKLKNLLFYLPTDVNSIDSEKIDLSVKPKLKTIYPEGLQQGFYGLKQPNKYESPTN